MDNIAAYEVVDDAMKVGNLDEIRHMVSLHQSEIGLDTFGAMAAFYNNVQLIQFVVEELGVDPQNSGLLSQASSKGYGEVVQYLVEQVGLDVREQSNQALCNAFRNHHYDIAEYLVKKGADVTRLDRYMMEENRDNPAPGKTNADWLQEEHPQHFEWFKAFRKKYDPEKKQKLQNRHRNLRKWLRR